MTDRRRQKENQKRRMLSMNDVVVKEVEFFGTELLAVKDVETGVIYAGINAILKDMGFDERQTEYRRNKWLSDKTLSKGVQKFSYPSENRGLQESYCINIKKLPLALAKLEITPKMEKEMPELSGKLEVYQDACADVLAAAFIPDNERSFEDIMIAQLQEQKKIKENVNRIDRKTDLINTDLQEFKKDMPLLGLECQRITRAKNHKVVPLMGGKKAPAYKDRGLRSRVYRDMESQLNREFGVDTYKAIKRGQCNLALKVIQEYELPMALFEEIRDVNAQCKLEFKDKGGI